MNMFTVVAQESDVFVRVCRTKSRRE